MNNGITGVLNGELAGRKHKLWAEINLGALVRNYNRICAHTNVGGKNAQVIPVIKADAYGHGAAESMLALIKAGARFFAVSSVAEAIELRLSLEKADVKDKIDIIILGYTCEEDADLLCKYDIIQTVFSPAYAESLSCSLREKLGNNAKVRVHIKLDTGMNRIGFDSKDNADISDIIRSTELENLICEGIFTHFVCADVLGSALTQTQLEFFDSTVKKLEDIGINFKVKHICNSAGILRDDICRYDAVRAGIILYGMTPSEEFDGGDFESVMALKARVAHVHELKPGESVSYGATFTADRDMRIATIPAGYGDGFIRAYSGATVRVGEKECPIVGRICMDQFMIDVTGTDVSAGDEAVLFESREKIERLSKMSRTISYETLCLIGKRVPRIYINE